MKPKIIVDTGTWFKFDELIAESIISFKFLDNLILVADIYITPEIEVELRYFDVITYKKIKNKIFVIPIVNMLAYEKAKEDGYDFADSSIIGVQNIKNFII